MIKNWYRLIIIIVLIITVSCGQKKSNIPEVEHSETERLVLELCKKEASYYFELFEGIKYTMHRGSYITNLNNGHKVRLRKIENLYLYRDSKDTISYNLASFSEDFEGVYGINAERTMEFIDFCYEFRLTYLHVREEDQFIFIKTPYCEIRYKKERPILDYEVRLCDYWYITDEDKFREIQDSRK